MRKKRGGEKLEVQEELKNEKKKKERERECV
jgi:hypothetical protein